MTDIGWSNRLGWYDGLHLLPTVTPNGVITGFGVGAASTKGQALADTFFALRQSPSQQMPSVGQPAIGPYVAERVATVARRRTANCGNGVRHVALHLDRCHHASGSLRRTCAVINFHSCSIPYLVGASSTHGTAPRAKRYRGRTKHNGSTTLILGVLKQLIWRYWRWYVTLVGSITGSILLDVYHARILVWLVLWLPGIGWLACKMTYAAQ